MADKEVKITISAIDKFSSTFNKLDDNLAKAGKASEKLAGAFDDFAQASGSSKLKNVAKEFATIAVGMQTTAGRAGLAVKAISSLVQGFNKLYSASKQNFASGLEKLGNVFGTILDGLGSLTSGFLNFLSQMTGADLSIAGLAQTATAYDEAMQRVIQIADTGTRSAGEAYAFLGNKAKKLAINSQYSTLEVAQGMQEMAQAGMNVQQVYDSMANVIALSTVGNISLARSAEIVSNGLNAFGMEASEAGHFADVLAKVANKSGTNVEQLGQALTNSSSVAGILGIKVDDVGIALGLMGDRFIKGGKAGTSLNNILTRLSAGTGQVNDVIEKYNLQGFKQKVLNGDLVGGLKELCTATEGLDEPTKAMIGNTLAGMYGMKGLLAIMDGGVEKIEELEQEVKGASGAWDIHNELMNTVQGRLLQVSSIMQVLSGEIFNKLSPALTGALTHLVDFGKSLLDIKQKGDETIISLKSMAQIVEMSEKWGVALANGVQKAISSIKGFVTGGSLDNILTIGTNIIQGICKGISNSQVDLQDTFSGLIERACNFITTNGEGIRKAGLDIMKALKDAIVENEDLITDAMETIMDIINSWADGAGDLKSTMGKFADTMIEGLAEAFVTSGKSKLKESWTAMWDFLTTGDGMGDIKNGNGKGGLGGKLMDWLFGESYAGEVTEESKTIGKGVADGTKQGYDENKAQITQSASETGTESANAINEALMSMDVGQLQALQNEMTNLGNTSAMVSESMSLSFNNIQNSARTAFMGMANIVRNQMLNCTNIIRNQALNMTNIVRNQALNMSNIFRNQFVNMANIARNQFVNVANIIRNQMVNSANIVRNQAVNMANIFRNQFVNMANITRNQMLNIANIVRNQMLNCTNIVRNQASNMSNAMSQGLSKMASSAQSAMNRVLSVIRSAMAQARAIASAPITINIQSNISRKVTTTHVAGGLKQTMANIGANSLSVGTPNVMSAGATHVVNPVSGNGANYVFTIPVTVDGREVARATAKYNQAELDKLNKRNARKRGE